MIGLPKLATNIPQSVHLAHTSPKGVQLSKDASPQKLGSLLVKAARYAKTNPHSKGTVGTGKAKGKNKVSKKTARAIVGKHAVSGPAKK